MFKKACGGTSLNFENGFISSLMTWENEVAWSCNSSSSCRLSYGSNGGYSIHFAQPTYQNGVQANATRGIPDVSSSSNFAYMLCFNATCYKVGGE